VRDRSLERVRARGLRVGYAVEAPYAFVDARGEVSGESATIARTVAERLSASRVQWVQTGFVRLVPELETGRFDVIASGLFITPERAAHVAFSRPTCRVGAGVLFRADQEAPPASCQALGPELRVAVVAGAVEAEALAACGHAQLVVVPDASAWRAAVLNGVVDALALSLPALRWMATEEGDLRAAPFDLDRAPGYPAFAFRRDDVALRVAWDEALAGYLGTPEHACADRGRGRRRVPRVRRRVVHAPRAARRAPRRELRARRVPHGAPRCRERLRAGARRDGRRVAVRSCPGSQAPFAGPRRARGLVARRRIGRA
jgi:polar amino acid transport system substrate-binding protein